MARKKCSIDYDDEWIRAHFDQAGRTDLLTEEYNKAHSTNISIGTFRAHCYNSLGLKRRTIDGKPFTPKEDEFLKQYYPILTENELEDEFVLHFGYRREKQEIRLRCWYLGVSKKQEVGIRSRKEAVRSELGTEYENQGYLFVKVTHDGRADKKWKLKHRVVWESVHGKIPEGHIILFLDGDTKNCDIENLACVPNSYNGYIQNNFLRRSDNPTITKTQIKWCDHKEALKNLKEGVDDGQ